MKTHLKATRAVAVPLAMFAFATHIADASPASPKTGSLTPPVASSAPYKLKSSLINNTSGQQKDIPNIRLSLVNATPYVLAYRWMPSRYVTFQVEYKAASEDPVRKAGWKRLTPVSAPSPPEIFDQSDEHVEQEQIRPSQEEELPNPSIPPAMPKVGFYRITATLTLPGASEFRGTVSPSTLVRSFALVVSSKPLIVRRTATGFVEVPAAASTTPAH